ncbi:MAG: glycosyltransferase family 39 protein, partial [Cyanobacteria bacterium J06632_3]
MEKGGRQSSSLLGKVPSSPSPIPHPRRLSVAEAPSPNALWRNLFIALIGLGIAFRIANLGMPVYWVDEVATSMRVSGYTRGEVQALVTMGQPQSVADLQRLQTIRRDRPATDLMRVLAKSPEHAPLYFVLARFWAALFGTSVVAMRSLPVIFSLLGLPAIYFLGRSLFASDGPASVQASRRGLLVGQIAVGLLAISPFFIAYAQEARPYSLWILLLLLMNQCLWRSLHNNRRLWWMGYALTLILTLYTSLLTVLVVVAQALWVLLFYRKRWLPYGLASGIAGIALLPWAYVVFSQLQTLQSNTAWTQLPNPIWATMATWFYGLAVLFFDVPVSFNPLLIGLQVIAATAVVALIVHSVWVIVRRAPRPVGSFVLAGAIAIPALLLIVDIARNGHSAGTPRYLMPTHLGALIALAYLISQWLMPPETRHSARSLAGWKKGAISFLITVSIVSGLIMQPSPYLKSRNLSNPELTALLNAADAPQVITTPHYINDAISLSYGLEPDISIYFLPTETASPAALLKQLAAKNDRRPTFLLAPSEEMLQLVTEQNLGELTLI